MHYNLPTLNLLSIVYRFRVALHMLVSTEQVQLESPGGIFAGYPLLCRYTREPSNVSETAVHIGLIFEAATCGYDN